MLLHQRVVLRTGSVRLLSDRAGTRENFNAIGDAFDFTEVAGPHLLVAFEHGEDLFTIRLEVDIREVNRVAAILWRLGGFEVAIKASTFGAMMGPWTDAAVVFSNFVRGSGGLVLCGSLTEQFSDSDLSTTASAL